VRRVKFNLKAARKFRNRFGEKPQKLFGHRRIYWVQMKDYDELDHWFGKALDYIAYLKYQLKKNLKPSRK